MAARSGRASLPWQAVQPPETPRNPRSTDEVNEFAQSLSKEFDVNLPVRGPNWSPSKRRKSPGDEALSKIRFLFYRHRRNLESAVADFRTMSSTLSTRDARMNGLLDQLNDQFYFATTPSTPGRGGHAPRRRDSPILGAYDADAASGADPPGSPTLAVKHAPERHMGANFTTPMLWQDFPLSRPGMRRSGDTSMVTSFATTTSTINQSRASLTTANTSFNSGFDGSNEAAPVPHSTIPLSSWSEQDIANITSLPSKRAPETRTESAIDRQSEGTVSKRRKLIRCACGHGNPKLFPTLARSNASDLPDTTSTSTVHHQVKNLPVVGFDEDPMCEQLDKLPFEHRVECLRIAKASGVATCALRVATKGDLDSFVESKNLAKSQWQPSSSAIWTHKPHPTDTRITFSGRMDLNPSSDGPLLRVIIKPMRIEDSCRFQRHFGWDRFFYVDVPSVDRDLPSHLSGALNKLQVQEAFGKWKQTEKNFMGRVWQSFHQQPIQLKRRHGAKGTTASPSHRIVFFAVSGEGIAPISLYGLLDWHLAFQSNLHQPSCKLFTRIDLALSPTKPAFEFKYSQISWPGDMMPDGVAEDTSFNDPRHGFPKHNDEQLAMNDGCAQISVGAAKQICEKLGIITRPSAFQARINGAKGMWFVSDSYETTDAKHTSIWIEITKSQIKIEPRDGDKADEICERGRWSFDVVKWSHTVRPSYLHRDFMQILEDRHVPRERLREFVDSRLQEELAELRHAIEDPVALRLWTHKHFSELEESELAEFCLPRTMFEKVNLLLEHGFHPKQYKPLAEFTIATFSKVLLNLRQNLRFECPRSTLALGIADPLKVLKPGEVHLCFSQQFCDDGTGESWAFLSNMEALVARHPTLWSSDIQKVKLVFKPELAHLKDIVVFPSVGCAPLASKLQGGDYDGDTFWLCWDPSLTSGFLNAPAPELPPIADFGIEKNTQVIKDVLDPLQVSIRDGQVRQWLSNMFAFNYRQNMLGTVTNYFYKLSYLRRNLHDPYLVEIAALHDHIIDASKNGYSFTETKFNAFLRARGLPLPNKIDMPGYRVTGDEMQVSGESIGKLLSLRDRIHTLKEEQSQHVLDNILATVIDPAIRKALSDVDREVESGRWMDADLEYTYRNLQSSLPPIDELFSAFTTEVAAIAAGLKQVERRWLLSFPESSDIQRDYISCLRPCYEMYQQILLSSRHAYMQALLQRPAPHALSHWECLKASILAAKHYRKPKLMFAVAREELCYLKSKSPAGMVQVAQLAALKKPKKPKDWAKRSIGWRAEVLAAEGSKPVDDEEFDFDLGDDDFWEEASDSA